MSKHKSKALGALHETLSDLHAIGVIDDKTMCNFDEQCLKKKALKKKRAKQAASQTGE